MNSSFLRRGLAAGLLLTSAAVPLEAEACGGLFCSSSAPVNQTAERILFAQGDGVTKQIVEILYEGPSERFAWVLPVPGTPEIGVSASQVFDRLQGATNPQYNLQVILPDECSRAAGLDGSFVDADAGAGGGTNEEAGPSVTVVDAGSVGPFDYETISVDAADQDPADVAIRWLEENEYDVGALGPDVLRPYLENGLNLLAVRLQKGQSSGSIQPLSLTFQGEQPSIPIRPTAVAANDDMGVMVWVLGEARAIPTNYLGLELNEALLDWTNANGTYNRVVTIAANEAGGKGFVTEFAGEAQPFEQTIASLVPRGALVSEGVPVHEQLAELARFGALDGFSRVFSQHVAFRDDLTADDFILCPYCYTEPEYGYVYLQDPPDYGDSFDPETDPISSTDVDALIAALEEEVFQPIADTAALFEEFPYLTRLYTTMSAGEMDEDPVFDFNPDLEDVSNVHTATQEFFDCGRTSWVVTLEDGRKVYSDDDGGWPFSTEADEDRRLPANVRIMSFSTSGPGVIETDNRADIDERLGARVPPSGFCAFRAGRGPGPTGILLLVIVLFGVAQVARRRRA